MLLEIKNIDCTPPLNGVASAGDDSAEDPDGPAGLGTRELEDPAEAAGEDVRLKNRQSSSYVASEGTFPAHITHSERLAGGFGWYAFRVDGGGGCLPDPVLLRTDGDDGASDLAGSEIERDIWPVFRVGGGGGSGAGCC